MSAVDNEGPVDDGLAAVRGAFQDCGATGQHFGSAGFSLLLARAHLSAGEVASANHVVDAALAFAAETGERVNEPELLKLKGACLLAGAATRGQKADPMEYFERAIAIAAERKARLFELRAVTSLCRVWRSARERLARLVGRFAAEDDSRTCAQRRRCTPRIHTF